MKTWEDLHKEGWIKLLERKAFRRPNGRIVSKKRDLTEAEVVEIGDLLFPGKRSKAVPADECEDSQAEDTISLVEVSFLFLQNISSAKMAFWLIGLYGSKVYQSVNIYNTRNSGHYAPIFLAPVVG